MKKFLFVLLAVAILAAAGVFFFIATFDINNYNTALCSQLESMVGNPVEAGRLSLVWKGQIVMGVESFKIYSRQTKETFLSFESADAAVQLAPLFGRHVAISSISVTKPNIHLIRTKEGKIEVAGYSPKAPEEPAGKAAEEAVAKKSAEKKAAVKGISLALDVASVTIKDGTLRFQDMMGDPPSDITVRSVNASVNNISAVSPIKFDANMAVSAAKQNLAFSGTAVETAKGDTIIKDFIADADLGGVDYAELLKSLPALEKAGLRKAGAAGILKVKVRELRMTSGKVSKISADLDFTNGRLAIAQLKAPLEQLNLSASIEDAAVSLKSFSGRLSSGALKGSAEIKDIYAAPKTTLKLAANVQGLKSFLSKAVGVNQDVDGNIDLNFDGKMQGASWPDMSRTMTGSGTFTLDRGVIVSGNMMRDAMGSLTVFPTLLGSIQGAAPTPVRRSLGENYTILKPFKQSYYVEGSYIMLPNLYFATDFLDFSGSAKVSFTGDLSGNGMARFSPQVSGTMINIIPQMQYLADQQGLVQFPIAFKGGSGSFKVIPDARYIAQKIAVQEAGRIVTDLLTEATRRDQPAQAAAGEAKQPNIKDILKSLMKE